jgi:hypothetical protein
MPLNRGADFHFEVNAALFRQIAANTGCLNPSRIRAEDLPGSTRIAISRTATKDFETL